MNELTWVEISKDALSNNVRQFRKLIGEKILCPCVKSNAYGHGLVETSRVFIEAGANWLAVNAIYEAKILRNAGITSPIYILGYVPFSSLEDVLNFDVRIVVYNKETIDSLSELANKFNKKPKVHIKIETGNNRQGVLEKDIVEFAKYVIDKGNIEIEGLSTHFANIEDTTDHSYAYKQIERFKNVISELEKVGINIPIKHCANSAATILFPETHFDMARTGIATYGMWPSTETYVSYLKQRNDGFNLIPAFTWKTKIGQIKIVPKDEYIGYGLTFKTTRDTKLAILPVGYYDGYDRGISNGGYVLINGKRAHICGRVCMNIIMVDVTDISDAKIEDEVVLIGSQGEESISAEQFGKWANTINYEVTTRVNERIPRIIV